MPRMNTIAKRDRRLSQPKRPAKPAKKRNKKEQTADEPKKVAAPSQISLEESKEPLFDNKQIVEVDEAVKEEEMSDDYGRSVSSFFSPTRSVDRSRSVAPPREIKEEEINEEDAPILEKVADIGCAADVAMDFVTDEGEEEEANDDTKKTGDREEELQKKVDELSKQLEVERASHRARIDELTAKLAEYDRLQQHPAQPAFVQLYRAPLKKKIACRFSDILKMTYKDEVYSKPTAFAGVTWRVQMFKKWNQLYFDLKGKRKDKGPWSCPITAELRVTAHNSERIYRKTTDIIFRAKRSTAEIGKIKLVSSKWAGSKHEWIRNDDPITAEVTIKYFHCSTCSTD